MKVEEDESRTYSQKWTLYRQQWTRNRLFAQTFQTSVLVTDPCIMALTVVGALSTASGSSRSADWLLVLGPVISQICWGVLSWRGHVNYPGELRAIISG